MKKGLFLPCEELGLNERAARKSCMRVSEAEWRRVKCGKGSLL